LFIMPLVPRFVPLLVVSDDAPPGPVRPAAVHHAAAILTAAVAAARDCPLTSVRHLQNAARAVAAAEGHASSRLLKSERSADACVPFACLVARKRRKMASEPLTLLGDV